MQKSALVFSQGEVNLLRPQRQRGRDKFTSQPAALVRAQRAYASKTCLQKAGVQIEAAIKFDSDVAACRTSLPHPVGNTGRTLEAGAV